jgi:predicted CXXCH cytochrome family protein
LLDLGRWSHESSGRRVRQRLAPRLVGAALLAVLVLLALTSAKPSRLRLPRDVNAIRLATGLSLHQGDCDRCHGMHGEDQPMVYANALTGPNDNALCYTCHTSPGPSLWNDPLYRATSHGSDPLMVWPGPDPPMRIEADAPTKCLNCHDPHGWLSGDSLVKHLALAPEEKLCLTCHDGHPASTDVRSELSMPFRHPVREYHDRHQGAGESLPSDFGVAPLNRRHSECEDCHNPHVSRADAVGRPIGSDASATTLGVSRVAVLNGMAGVPPTYTFLAGADTLTPPVVEFQLCFKCHSSWTTQPSGQSDLALLLNPNNPSFHPVEAVGRNPGIQAPAFVPGWGAGSLTRCGSCHGSDLPAVRGVHGSLYPAILRKNSVTSSATHASSPDELCFSCHTYGAYADPAGSPIERSASRFNAPASPYGHAEHVGTAQVPCFACHETHGSTGQPFLIVTGRVPGLTSYTSSPTGGTCTSTCHVDVKTYGINYAR